MTLKLSVFVVLFLYVVERIEGDGHSSCTSAVGNNTCHIHINEIFRKASGVMVELFYDGRMAWTPTDYYILAHVVDPLGFDYTVRYLKRINCTFNSNGFCIMHLGDSHVTMEQLVGEGTKVIALYKDITSKHCDIKKGSTLKYPASCGLEAVILTDGSSGNMTHLKTLFHHNSSFINQERSFHNGLSVQRCLQLGNSNQYGYNVHTATPMSFNNCTLPNVTINEFDFNAQFLELRGMPNMSLQNIVLVLYSSHFNHAYKTISLDRDCIGASGFFVIGSSNDTDKKIAHREWMQVGSNAVALYFGDEADFPEAVAPVDKDPRLIDALVYGETTDDTVATTLISLLIKGQYQIEKDPRDISTVSRCNDVAKPLDVSTYGLAYPTPGCANDKKCTPVQGDKQKSLSAQQDLLIINEIDAHYIHKAKDEFIEIYDQGQGLIDLTDITVAFFYTATNSSYITYDLSGYRTNEQGYFTIASSGDSADLIVPIRYRYFLDEHLITLYKRKFRYMKLTTTNLLDAVLFKKGGEPDNTALLNYLLVPPGQPQLVVRPTGFISNTSLSRCYSNQARLNTAFSVTSIRTPGGPNHCELPPVVISEINVHSTQGNSMDFVELSSLGIPFFPLDRVVEVHYNALQQYNSISWSQVLVEQKTDANGFFVVGTRTSPNTSLQINKDFIANGPSAIALYYGTSTSSLFQLNDKVHNHSLIDAVCYGTKLLGGYVSRQVLETLTPGRQQVTEPIGHSVRDESINRCETVDGVVYLMGSLSAGSENVCNMTRPTLPPPKMTLDPPELIINEVDSTIPTHPEEAFIELYSARTPNFGLDGYTLVFYDAVDSLCYLLFDLSGRRTNSNGYFVIGGSRVSSAALITNETLIQRDLDAIVLYYAPARWFVKGKTKIMLQNIVDYVILGDKEVSRDPLFNELYPGQLVLSENDMVPYGSDRSISRCLSHKPMSQREFFISPPTPGKKNNCTRQQVLINEVSISVTLDKETDFVELFDGGAGRTPLTGLTVVFFEDVGAKPIRAVDLTGYQTNIKGYYLLNISKVISNNKVAFNACVAVTIYNAHGDEFPVDSVANTTDLVDAVIFHFRDTDAHLLRDILLPGQKILTADFQQGTKSLRRCCWVAKQLTTFGWADPTPGLPNNCNKCPSEQSSTQGATTTPYAPPNHLPDVVINEIDSDQHGPDTHEFIELKGAPGTRLDGYSLVLFNGRTEEAYWVKSLDGYRVNSNGLFTIGSSKVDNVDVAFMNMGLVQNGIDAVTLFDGRGLSLSTNMRFDSTGLRDAVFYTKYPSDAGAEGFFESVMKSTSNDIIIEDQGFRDGTESINRCSCDTALKSRCFILSQPTPNQPNACPVSTLSVPFQMRLTDAKCSRWQIGGRDNQTKLFLLRDLVSTTVNKKCNCGFSADYIANFSIIRCGSITFEGYLQAINKEQQLKIMKGFSEFINSTQLITIDSETFAIDRKCHMTCSPSNEKHPSLGMVIGASIGSALGLGVVIFIAVYCVRRRKDREHFRLKILDEDDDGIPDLSLSSHDDRASSVTNFTNPTYSRLTNADL